MVALLSAAVVLVGLLGVVNLVFSFGVIRRLREHTEILGRLGTGASPGPPVKLVAEPGETIADFAAETLDGEPVSARTLTGLVLVGFFAPGCPACEAQVDRFATYAGEHPGGRDQVLAVVTGGADEARRYIEPLADAARVVLEPERGPVSKAFQVVGYPAFLMLDDGAVQASSFEAVYVVPKTVKH